jgi:hypothetical protein
MPLNEQLKARYIAALKAVPTLTPMLNSYRAGPKSGLNDVFFPGVDAQYDAAPLKVMVVGRETTCWNYGNFSTAATLTDYVERGMSMHREHSRKFLQSPASASGLIRLLKSSGNATSDAGVIWSNLFAVSHNAADPRKNQAAWPYVRVLSRSLLDIQIEILQPDVIIFANGIDSAGVRREFFPHAKASGAIAGDRCTGSRHWESEKISARHLWGFHLDERIECFRIHHPSAKFHRAKAAAARKVLLRELKERQQDRLNNAQSCSPDVKHVLDIAVS